MSKDETAQPYAALGVVMLAKLTHQAEDEGDDINFLAIQAEIERRPHPEREAYRLEWIRQHRRSA